jgi:hypothetical protein
MSRAREVSKIVATVDSVENSIDNIGNIDLSSTINTASAAAVAYLIDGAPAALNTLNELAAALDDNADILDLYLTQSSASSNYATKTSPTFTGTSTFSDAIVSGKLNIFELTESIIDATITSGSATLNFNTSNIFYISSPSANFTINLTNTPTDNEKTITITVLVLQGTTGYIPNAFFIDGVSQTIKWAAGVAPTPTSSAGKIDIFNFSLVRRSSSWTVFATSSTNF